MSFEVALAARLLNAASVAQAVDQRVDWMKRVQNTARPAITLEVISDVRDQHYGGFHPSVTRVQIDVWTDDFLSSIALRDAVIDALIPAAAVGGVRFQRGQGLTARPARDTDADGADLYRQIIDITFTHTKQEVQHG